MNVFVCTQYSMPLPVEPPGNTCHSLCIFCAPGDSVAVLRDSEVGPLMQREIVRRTMPLIEIRLQAEERIDVVSGSFPG
jgi:hypothetical protein